VEGVLGYGPCRPEAELLDDAQTLFALPVETLMAVGGGYLAYRAGHIGLGSGHDGADKVLFTLLFGGVVLLASEALEGAGLATGPALVAGAAAAIGAALVWRRGLAERVRRLAAVTGLVRHDGRASAWQTMLTLEGTAIAQVVVQCDDGSSYMCDAVAEFTDTPIGGCLLGEDGSVAMAVTHYRSADGATWRAVDDLRHPSGTLVTVFPAARIKFVDLRVS